MKIISANASVTLRVTFTMQEADALEQVASHHYDAVCRTLPVLKEIKITARTADDFGVSLTWRDLDILSKICESPLVPKEVSQTVWATFANLRQITLNAQQEVEEIVNGC
jgi:hypothetical protein